MCIIYYVFIKNTLVYLIVFSRYIHKFFMLAWMLVNAWPAAFVARRHRGPSQRARASRGP